MGEQGRGAGGHHPSTKKITGPLLRPFADRIRNIAIIAHIDHGKSTLADRLIQICGGLTEREMRDQVLDSMDLERERGITIKAQTVTLHYKARDGNTYILNFMDTPGHVDFSYEVSRSLSACEGAILLVDSSQGVEAQTLANTYTAVELGVEVLPVLNKIDLPQAEPARVQAEIEDLIGLPAGDCLPISAKNGEGIDALLETLVHRIPPPKGRRAAPLQALIVDSWFNAYTGVISLVRVVNGEVNQGDRIIVASKGAAYKAEELGTFTPKKHPQPGLTAGEIGYVSASIKDIQGAPVGDSLIGDTKTRPLPGLRKIQPRIFAGFFPLDSGRFPALRDALDRLSLNDASLTRQPINSSALGAGFRLGLLGLLHLDIVRARLEREYQLDILTTTPDVAYRAQLKDGTCVEVDAPDKMPAKSELVSIEEPIANVTLLTAPKYLGAVLHLCQEYRGRQRSIKHHTTQVTVEYELPLGELMVNFFDRLNAVTSGYASMDYRLGGYKPVKLVKMDILINGRAVDALARLTYADRAPGLGRAYVEKLKTIIPRQLFAVALQAAIGSKIIARATVSALRKNVTAKCYGGDVTRKRKLLDKQRRGKKRMKVIGNVEVPPEAFVTLLTDDLT